MSIKINPILTYRIMSLWTGRVLTRGDNGVICQRIPLVTGDPFKTQEWVFEQTGKLDEYIIRSPYQGAGKLVIKAPDHSGKSITFGKQEGTENEVWKIATPDDIGAYLKSKPYGYSHEIGLESNAVDANVCSEENESFYTHRWYIFPIAEWADDKKDNS